MPTRVKIQGGTSHKPADVKNTKEFGNGLKVFTYTGERLYDRSAFFTNETYGSDMNQDASTGGTPDRVHNGIDTILWTASAIAGTWTFNDPAQAHISAQSIGATATVNNDVAQIAKGSNLTIANYVSLTGWIYITGWSTSGTKQVNVVGWDTGTAAAVSSSVNIGNYVDTTTLNTWQKFTIPFADFGFTSTTLDAIRITTVDIGAGPPPNYYLDDIQFEQTGGSIIYEAGPQPGEVWEVNNINVVFADAYAGTVTNGTMPSIPYDGFLGVSTLTSGIVFKVTQGGQSLGSSTYTDFIDIMSMAERVSYQSGSDGTNTWLRVDIEYPHHFRLEGKNRDKLEVTINDDLTGLLHFRSNVNYSKFIDIE
jgi:hypothetical protein